MGPLLYVTSWMEGKPPFNARRSWKGHRFEVLDQLIEKGLLDGSRRAKSVWFAQAGEKEAEALLERYGLEKPRNHKQRKDPDQLVREMQ
ncbi:MAG: DUF6429 family protein [Bacillota bacterium]